MNSSKITTDVPTHTEKSLSDFSAGTARVLVFGSVADSAAAAASHAAARITAAVRERGTARIIAATGNSQKAFIDALVLQKDVPWNRVTLFHMDEYVGIRDTHPASFRLWIRTRMEERLHPKEAHYIEGDAPNVEAEAERYSKLLLSDDIDVAFVGIGENGHIAFNDPPVADFEDSKTVKCVTLDDACKRQQAGEGHFESAAAVPDRVVPRQYPIVHLRSRAQDYFVQRPGLRLYRTSERRKL